MLIWVSLCRSCPSGALALTAAPAARTPACAAHTFLAFTTATCWPTSRSKTVKILP